MRVWESEDARRAVNLARAIAEVEAQQRVIDERVGGLNPLVARKVREGLGSNRTLEVDPMKADPLVPPDSVLIRPTAWARLIRVGTALRLTRIVCKVNEHSGLLAEPTGPPELWEAMRDFATPECLAKEQRIADQQAR